MGKSWQPVFFSPRPFIYRLTCSFVGVVLVLENLSAADLHARKLHCGTILSEFALFASHKRPTCKLALETKSRLTGRREKNLKPKRSSYFSTLYFVCVCVRERVCLYWLSAILCVLAFFPQHAAFLLGWNSLCAVLPAKTQTQSPFQLLSLIPLARREIIHLCEHPWVEHHYFQCVRARSLLWLLICDSLRLFVCFIRFGSRGSAERLMLAIWFGARLHFSRLN